MELQISATEINEQVWLVLCTIHACHVRMWFWGLVFSLTVGTDGMLYRASP